jgi:hypothetical protein
MKRNTITLALVSLLTLVGLQASAKYSEDTGFHGPYLFHTTKSAIDFKKGDALQWHENNVDKKKFYYLSFYHEPFHTAVNEIATQKHDALEWYEDNVDKNKFYYLSFYHEPFHNAINEIGVQKRKALKWYERNSES